MGRSSVLLAEIRGGQRRARVRVYTVYTPDQSNWTLQCDAIALCHSRSVDLSVCPSVRLSVYLSSHSCIASKRLKISRDCHYRIVVLLFSILVLC